MKITYKAYRTPYALLYMLDWKKYTTPKIIFLLQNQNRVRFIYEERTTTLRDYPLYSI